MYSFLVEGAKIESTLVRYGIATSEANVKTNIMGRAKWTITKNGVFPVSTLFFKIFCFSLRTFYKELNCCTSYPNVNIQIFRKQWSFTLIEQTSLSTGKFEQLNRGWVSSSCTAFLRCQSPLIKWKLDTTNLRITFKYIPHCFLFPKF